MRLMLCCVTASWAAFGRRMGGPSPVAGLDLNRLVDRAAGKVEDMGPTALLEAVPDAGRGKAMVVTKGAVASRAVTTALVGCGREVAISVSSTETVCEINAHPDR
jgi:hypothetical protein